MRLKALLIGMAMLCAVPAHAQTILNSGAHGNWTWLQALTPQGKRICAINNANGERSFHLKHIQGLDHMVVHLIKDSWNIPANTTMRVTLKFGAESPWNMNTSEGIKDTVQLRIGTQTGSLGADVMDLFLKELRNNSVALVAFPDGAEPVWTLSLLGSGQAINSYTQCIQTWSNIKTSAGNGPTQPFGTNNATPNQPTQPHGVQASGPARRS